MYLLFNKYFLLKSLPDFNRPAAESTPVIIVSTVAQVMTEKEPMKILKEKDGRCMTAGVQT